MSAWCRESGQTVGFSMGDVSATSPRTGRPSKVLMTCRRCHRPGLEARVCLVQVALGHDDGIATVPHHYVRGDS